MPTNGQNRDKLGSDLTETIRNNQGILFSLLCPWLSLFFPSLSLYCPCLPFVPDVPVLSQKYVFCPFPTRILKQFKFIYIYKDATIFENWIWAKKKTWYFLSLWPANNYLLQPWIYVVSCILMLSYFIFIYNLIRYTMNSLQCTTLICIVGWYLFHLNIIYI